MTLGPKSHHVETGGTALSQATPQHRKARALPMSTIYLTRPRTGTHRLPHLGHRLIDWFLYYWSGE